MLNYTKTERREGNLISWRLVHADKKDELIGEIEFLLISDEIWLNNIGIEEEYRRLKIATSEIKLAVKKFTKLMISKSEKGEHKRNNIIGDRRYIDSEEGLLFINSMIEQGILKKEWIKDAF